MKIRAGSRRLLPDADVMANLTMTVAAPERLECDDWQTMDLEGFGLEDCAMSNVSCSAANGRPSGLPSEKFRR